jgi:calcium/proton exchanger cax
VIIRYLYLSTQLRGRVSCLLWLTYCDCGTDFAVSIIALIKCELQVVQSSLIGSILSNLLLVCGMSFFLGEPESLGSLVSYCVAVLTGKVFDCS